MDADHLFDSLHSSSGVIGLGWRVLLACIRFSILFFVVALAPHKV
jgi:hypothetical protein